MIGRRQREVAFLVARPVSKIILGAAGVPATLFRVDKVIPRMLVLVETDIVENEKLRLRAEINVIDGPLFCKNSSAFFAISADRI
jgi:hypothetical protein